ncbi:MAG: CPBP family intramembrane metalloprotease [[Eubacterium] sulci]|nr:CPBP family intramembrane metalloprotease [[Eubacterium] sulci]
MERKPFDKKKILFLLFPIALWIANEYLTNIFYIIPKMLLTYLPLSDDFVNRSASFIDASISISLIIVYLILYKLMFREKLEPEVRLSKPQSTLFTIIISFGVGGVSTIWLDLFQYISTHFQTLSEQVDDFSTLYDDMEQSPYIWTLLAIAIVGPIVEEIMFRGLIYRSLEKAIETPWIPIVISGVMFGVWHGSFIQGVYTAILGIILAYYYKKTRSLFLVIMVHIINNFLSTLPPAWDTDFSYSLILGISYLCIGPMIAIFVYIHRKSKKQVENTVI